ncbi:SETMR methyltransferase, partial [Acromyrmex insinuator]
MDKNYFRSLIKHYFLRGKTVKETKEKLDKYYVANAPSDYTVKYWFREFRGGRNSTTDEVRSGRPSDAVTEENVKKIHEMVLADRKVKVRELADATKISTERTCHILGEILHMKKLSCRWVPRMLTPDQKHERESTSKESLDLLMRNRADFWRRLVTVDETWIHYYTPENRMSARQWTEGICEKPFALDIKEIATAYDGHIDKEKYISYYTLEMKTCNIDLDQVRPSLQHPLKVYRFFLSISLDKLASYLDKEKLKITQSEFCVASYSLDPAHYYLPGFMWDVMLKYTRVRFELLTEIDIVLFIERGTHGGLSQCSDRYAQANNKYMRSYDLLKPSSYLMINNKMGRYNAEAMIAKLNFHSRSVFMENLIAVKLEVKFNKECRQVPSDMTYRIECENKKAKGIKNNVARTITFDDYTRCRVYDLNYIRHTRGISESKIALSPYNDKRYVVPDSTETLQYLLVGDNTFVIYMH